MILPIYSVIVKLDHSLLEAARDLGADGQLVFRRVILPLSLPGVLSGVTMVYVPSVSNGKRRRRRRPSRQNSPGCPETPRW